MEMQSSTTIAHDGFFLLCNNKQHTLDNNEMSSFHVNFDRKHSKTALNVVA